MRRTALLCSVFVVLAIALLVAAPGGPPAKALFLRLDGTLDGRFSFVPYYSGTWDFLSVAQATGDLRGFRPATIYTTHQPHEDGTLTGGEFRIVSGSGEVIYGTYEGSAAYLSAEQVSGQAALVVTGGTGRFSNATGTLSGEFLETLDDPTWASAGVSWSVKGTVTYQKPTGTETITYFNFADPTTFAVGGGGAAFWGLAPLAGTPFLPSQFVQGGSSTGTIFYGSWAKDSANPSASTVTLSLPDLSGYKNLRLSVALAAPPGIWEPTHRDSLRIIGGVEGAPVPVVDCSLSNGCASVPGAIDTFLPPAYPASLRSQVHGVDLVSEFQDLEYAISNDLRSLTFAFASTDYPELVGIDSVRITGEPIGDAAPKTGPVIDTMPYWTGTGWGNRWTVGQIFTTPVGYTTLEQLTFYAQGAPGPVEFSLYVMEWDGLRATGSVLFDSGPFSVSSGGPIVGGFYPISTRPHLTLQPGRQYVAFLSGAYQSGRPSDALYVPLLDSDAYGGGYAVTTAAFEDVTTWNWGRLDVNPARDIGFRARFAR
jgi:hypothetical protein